MAIKFEKIEEGMTLFDIYRTTMGRTSQKELSLFHVPIVTLDKENRTARVSWNGNTPKLYTERELCKLYIKEPPAYIRQEAQKAARRRDYR